MRPNFAWVLGLGLGLSLGCTGASVFVCTGDQDCDDGRCEPNGYCSFPSEDCDSGWIYGELSAPQLAGDCVGEGEDTEGGGTTGGGTSTVSVTGGVTTNMPPLDTGEATADSAETSIGTDPTNPTDPTDPTDPTTVTTDPGTSDTGDCVPLEPTIAWIEDGQIFEPMQLTVAQDLPGQHLYAYSEVAEQGAVFLASNSPCDEEVFAWLLVLDPIPGDNLGSDPDSFYLSLDMGSESLLEYGCYFNEMTGPWAWVPIADGDGCPQGPDPIVLMAGDHTIQIRNNEAATKDGHAGIAALFVASDPGAHPEDLFPLAP